MGNLPAPALIIATLLSTGAFAAPASNAKLLQDWRAADRKIESLSRKETELLNQRLNIELALSETTENIKSLGEMIETKRSIIISRIRYLNNNSGTDLIRNLIESSNPGELERNHKVFMIATRLDLEMVRLFNKDLVKLEKERQKQSQRIAKLNELHRDLKTEADEFIGELKKKGQVLNQIRTRLKSNSKVWTDQLNRAIANNDVEKINLYQSLLNKNFLDRKGQLTSPTNGPIKIRFGVLKMDSVTPALPFHGILFESSPDTPVRAIADGTVVWTGSISGLGETLVLDHGRDLHSVYSRIRLSKLKAGDLIKEGAHIGSVARSNDRMGNGLYFEIRENSLPTDPSRWILTNSELLSKENNPWESVQ